MSDFSEILNRARGGDSEAVSALYEKYARPAEQEARSGLGPTLRSRFETSDIVQSVFADMLVELATFEDRGEPSFRHWLRIKIRNKLRTKARRLTGRRGLRERQLGAQTESALADDEDPHEGVSLREQAEKVSLLLGSLRPEQREIIGMFIDQQLPWAEVAARLGLRSAGAARLRYVRAIAALHAKWNRT
jgi:RNA polymerase sigma-70 factor (ECF subfamily)